MRLRRAVNRAILWAGMACAAAVGAAWVFSLFRTVEYAPAGIRAYALAGGCLSTDIYFRSVRYLTVLRAPGEPVWYLEAARPVRWWFLFEGSPRTDHVAIPLWALAAIGASVAALAAAYRPRPVPGLCRRCGYDRSSLPPGSACPECGALDRSAPLLFSGRPQTAAAPGLKGLHQGSPVRRG
jgi:hypothetical protein